MEQPKTHWKKLHNPDYIGAYTLMDGQLHEMVVSIASIAREKVIGADGKKDECTVAKLYGQKPFILNATNQKTLTKLFDSPYIEDWVNRPFTIYVSKVRIAGESVDALRIRPEHPKPPQLPELTPQHEKWAGAIEALKSGKTTIEAIRKAFILSQQNEQLLINATTTV